MSELRQLEAHFMEDAKARETVLKEAAGMDSAKTNGQNSAGELITLVEESGAELFRDPFKEPWACIPSGEHQEIVKVRGRFFRRWLAGKFWKAKGKAAPSETIRAAMNVLESMAVFDGKQHPLHVRLAWDGDDLWYDLMPQAVRIN